MFSIQGEVISDQFYPLKFIWFWVSLRRYGKKTVCFGNFALEGGGSPIPKSKCQNSDKILTFFVKTKNDPYGLKCKINPKIFFRLRGFQKGGGPPFGKNSQKIPFFFFEDPPYLVGEVVPVLWKKSLHIDHLCSLTLLSLHLVANTLVLITRIANQWRTSILGKTSPIFSSSVLANSSLMVRKTATTATPSACLLASWKLTMQ